MNVNGGPLDFVALLDESQFRASMRNMRNDVSGFTSNIQIQGNQIETFAKRAAIAATSFLSLQAASGFVQKFVEVRGQFQQLEVAFTTMLRSKEASNKLMAQMVQLAATTPFTLSEVATSGKQLLAYGFAADKITDNLTKLGDVAAGVSAPIGDIAYLYGTLRTQGVALTKDIREFSGRGIPIIAELAKVLKTTEAGVSDMVTAGKVGFPEVEKAFNNMTSAGGMFFNLMKEQSKTLTGRISNLSDAWQNMLNSLGKSQEGIFSASIQATTDLVNNYENVLSIITVLVSAYGVYKAALITTAAFEKAVSATNLGLVVALDQESIARTTSAAASLNEMRAEVANLAVKKAAAIQSAQNALASLKEAQAKVANISTEGVLAATEKASIARKKALAVSAEFFAKKMEVENAAKNASSASNLNTLRSELSVLAVKKESATQSAIQAAANVKVAESGVLQVTAKKAVALQNNVIAAQEKVEVTRKAAIAASSSFVTAKTELETVAKNLNTTATLKLSASETILAANKRISAGASAIWNKVLLATPAVAVAATVTALGVAIYALSQTTNAAAVSQKALNDLQSEVAGQYAEQSLTIKDYVKIIKDSNSTENERNTALKKLVDLNPNILGALNAQNVTTKQGSEAIQEYLTWLDAKLQGEAAYVIKSDAVRRMAERNIKAGLAGNELTGGLDWVTRFGYGLKNLFTGKSRLKASDEASDIVNMMNQQDQAIIDGVDKQYSAQLKQRALDSQGGDKKENKSSNYKNKAFYEEIVKTNTEALEALDAGSKDFEKRATPLKAKIKAAKEELLKFDVTGKSYKIADKASDQEEAALKRRAEMLQRIYDLNDKYNNKSLTDDEHKLAEIRSQYKSLQSDINAYNKDPKNKKINPNLKPALEKAIQNQEYQNNTDKLKIELDKQKTLYQEYEDYKSTLGKDAADERFKSELNTSVSFMQKLEAERAKLLDKDPTDMSGPELNRLRDLDKRISEEVESEKKKYDTLVKQFISYSNERKALEEEYEKDIVVIQSKGGDISARTKAYNDKRNSLDDGIAKDLEPFKALFKGIDQLSDANAKKVITNAQTMLSSLVAKGKISKELAEEIAKMIKSTDQALKDRMPDRLINLAQEIDKVAAAVSEVDEGFSKMLSTLGNVVGQVGNIKKGLGDMKIAQGSGDVLGQLSAGLGIFGAGMSIVSSIGKLFDRSAEREAQASYSRELQNKQTEAINKALERQISLIDEAYGTERLIKYNEALAQITKDEAAYQKQLEGKFSLTGDKTVDKIIKEANGGLKGAYDLLNRGGMDKYKIPVDDINALQRLLDEGRLDETTATVVENLLKAKEAAIDLANNLKADTIGSSLDSIADDFIGALTDGTQDFGKTFENTIRTSILNGFKGRIIEQQLQGFYDQFAQATSDGGLSKDEIEALRKAYLTASDKAKKDIEDLEKATGISLTDQSGNASSTKPRGIQAELTEATGSELKGLWRGQYDLTKTMSITAMDHLKVARIGIDNLIKIEQHTLRGANNTDNLSTKLDQIITNTKPPLSAKNLPV
jgi:hypothetical protein